MRAPQPRPELLRFGKYTLVERLATGGMAEIFLARQDTASGFAKTVVLKRIRPQLGSQPAFVKMFLNEARLAAQLTHPNIVEIHDLGKVADSYYIVMDYISGRDMRKVLPRAESMGIPFPMAYAIKIAAAVAEGLGYAHRKTDLKGNPLNIVHRDVTPENVLVSFDGTVKILDFGIAKAANQAEKTKAGEIKGKVSYMSPEQALGEPIDSRSDLFSLGVVLYEWLTGYKLFTGDSDVAILKSITEGRINLPSYFRPEIPRTVEKIVMRALEKDRDRRYQTAEEMKRELDAYLASSDFLPSNIHLSNFLKQLFHDELSEEHDRLNPVTPSHTPLPPPVPTPPPMTQPSFDGPSLTPVEVPELVPAAVPVQVPEQVPELSSDDLISDPGIGTERTLAIRMTVGELDSLLAVAKKAGQSPEDVAREVLINWLKYR